MFRLSLSLFVLSFLLTPSAWSASTTRLVEIYCDRISANDSGDASEKAWNELVLELRERRDVERLSEESTAPYQRCLSEREGDFEAAEFALKGLEQLGSASEGLRAPSEVSEESLLPSQIRVAGLEVTLDGRIAERFPKMDAPQSRRERYEALWTQVVNELKFKLFPPAF